MQNTKKITKKKRNKKNTKFIYYTIVSEIITIII